MLQRHAATSPTLCRLLRRRACSSGSCFGRLKAPGDGLRGRSTPAPTDIGLGCLAYRVILSVLVSPGT